MNLFKIWFCPDCKSFLRRWNLRKKTKEIGMDYFLTTYMCINCGKENTMPFNNYLMFKAQNGEI